MDKLREMQLLLTKIPKGRVTTYSLLAKKLNVNPRQAGRLLSRNTRPSKYPCYKVVLSSGKIGGYSGEGGIKRKAYLLKADGIEISNGKIDLSKYLYSFRKV